MASHPYSYTVAPHLEYFNVPLPSFTVARPEFDSFAVGAYIFASSQQHDSKAATSSAVLGPPRLLLLQRALTDSMGGCWEGPGGASEPGVDATLLDGVVREVLEESGLHVSRIVELVAVDSWVHPRRKIRIAKYSFIVEVHETGRPSPLGEQSVLAEDIPIRLEPTEHQAFNWATEEQVQRSLMPGAGSYQFPQLPFAHQAPNILWAFELCELHRQAM